MTSSDSSVSSVNKNLPLFFFSFFFCASCGLFSTGPDEGTLPMIPVNLEDFNTEYDDYNSTAPTLGDLIPFCFSTNRISLGNHFDIIFLPMNVNFVKDTEELTVTSNYANWSTRIDDYDIINRGVGKIRTTGNEYGPNLIVENGLRDLTLMYSSDISGDAQIYFISNITDSLFSEPLEVSYLNSDFDDMYPSFNADRSRIYFCSNREEDRFDFYYTEVDSNIDTESILLDTSTHEILKDETLSSSADDKCPLIFGDKMVFASNRAGGFGGYDLYSSTFVNGSWTPAVNLGPVINSEADEFRPILIEEGVSSSQDMLVFSSNRVGGKGGFDLYFVGLESN